MPYIVPEELNDSNGDIILRSSDQINFCVFRWPLQRLYPVFSDMFHLPDPGSPSPDHSSRPVVQMNETAIVIEALLRLSYPVEPPVVQNLREMTLIIEAIIKLQAEARCRWWIRMTTEKLVAVDPWAMYAILLALSRKACDYNLEEEIRIAARGTVGRPLIRPWKEASIITAADYDRLLEYHSECRNRFLMEKETILYLAGSHWPWFDRHCPAGGRIEVGASYLEVPLWFLDFNERVMEKFHEELQGETVEDVALWYDLLERDRGTGDLCLSCAESSASHMPTYAKLLSEIMERTVSKVSNSPWSTGRQDAEDKRSDRTLHSMVNLGVQTIVFLISAIALVINTHHSLVFCTIWGADSSANPSALADGNWAVLKRVLGSGERH